MDSFKQIFAKVHADYMATRNKKVMLVDAFILYTVATAAVQVAYLLLGGSFPFNSFLSSLFCHLALFALSVSLRLQISSSEFNVTPLRAFGDFALSVVVLLFVVYSFLG